MIEKSAAQPPSISIIVVNWNGAQILPQCLAAISAQTIKDYEVIVVDNASGDGSADEIEKDWPGIQVLRLEKNIGFAAANNRAALLAKGRGLALLNNDAFPNANWLETLIAATQRHTEVVFFASCLVQAKEPNHIDSAGDICHISGLAWNRGHNQIVDRAILKTEEVFSPCAAAGFYERNAFLQVGGFDEIYFSHHEDIDLGFRLRLFGWRCLYIPEAIVKHIGSASFGGENAQTIYQAHRNMVWTYFKNMPGHLVWQYLPAHLLANLIFLFYYSVSGQAKPIWRAKWDALKGLPKIFRMRRKIQILSKVHPNEIKQVLDHHLLSPYLLGKNADQIQRWARRIGIIHL